MRPRPRRRSSCSRRRTARRRSSSAAARMLQPGSVCVVERVNPPAGDAAERLYGIGQPAEVTGRCRRSRHRRSASPFSSTSDSSPFSSHCRPSKTALAAVQPMSITSRLTGAPHFQSKTNVVANSRLDVSNSVPRPGGDCAGNPADVADAGFPSRLDLDRVFLVQPRDQRSRPEEIVDQVPRRIRRSPNRRYFALASVWQCHVTAPGYRDARTDVTLSIAEQRLHAVRAVFGLDGLTHRPCDLHATQAGIGFGDDDSVNGVSWSTSPSCFGARRDDSCSLSFVLYRQAGV